MKSRDEPKGKMKFLLFCSIILSGLWFEASTHMSVTEGQRAVLDCGLPADNSTNRTVSWYRQHPGGGPQLLLSYPTINTTNVKYGPGFNSSRFSALTGVNETHLHQLLIIPTKEHDTAVYYCALSMDANSQ